MAKTFEQWVAERRQGYSKGGPLYEVAEEAYNAGVDAGITEMKETVRGAVKALGEGLEKELEKGVLKRDVYAVLEKFFGYIEGI